MTATQSKLLTAADLEAMADASDHTELVEGVLHEMPPSGGLHGDLQAVLH